jgi:hypothetical protein
MVSRRLIWVLMLSLFLGGRASAGNEALAQAQTVAAGERVANYLQSLMISFSAFLEAKKPGNLLNSAEIYRVGVTYNPEEKMIDISVVGNQEDPVIARRKLELTQKLLMSFSKKIEKNFGVILGENDFNMDYLDAKSNRIILKYRDGNFQATPKPTASVDTPDSQISP